MIIIKAFIFLLLLLASFLLIQYFHQEKIVDNAIHKAHETLDLSNRMRIKEKKEDASSILLKSVDVRLQYSNLKNYIPFLTTEIWLLLILGFCAISYFVCALIKGWMFGIIGMAVTSILLRSMEAFLIHKNYNSVEEQLVVLLNLLENYSVASDEITDIFFKISKYLKDPLKSALAESYYEAQTSGNTSVTLERLSNKIEHPKFKELIRNIEICSRYNADYKGIVANSRKGIRDFVSYRKKRKIVINAGKTTIFMLVVFSIIIFTAFSYMSDYSIWHVLLNTNLGKLFLVYFGGLLIFFYMQIVMFDKG